jgi:hypothetical protein
MPHFSKYACVFTILEIKEMGSWSGKILMYLVYRYRRILRKEINKKIENLNLEKSVYGISLQGVSATGHIATDICH